MNAFESPLPIVRATLDADGLLLAADPQLLELNARAGGALNAPLALPALATICRLARRLGILVSRQVHVADVEADLRLWVRAKPVPDGLELSISGWSESPACSPDREHAQEFVAADADWMWETDAGLRLTYLPVSAALQAGADVQDLLGQPITRLFELEGDEAGALPILSGLALRRAFTEQPARLRGRNSPVRLSAVPRLDRAGNFAGYIGGVREEAVQSASPPPEALSGDFATRLNAALRGSLDRIIANADSMNAQAEGPLSPDYVGYAADIAQAGRHLLGLVGDLADLEAVERPGFVAETEAVDLADLARRSAGLMAVRAGEAGVRIEAPAPGETLPATGEFRRVLQILVNLLGNAMRYSPRGATIWLRLKQDGDTAIVIVADQGKGIAAEDQARIFEKFERVDPGELGGSGLGLFIARRLARAMGGDLTVDSATGQGARFILSLPARR